MFIRVFDATLWMLIVIVFFEAAVWATTTDDWPIGLIACGGLAVMFVPIFLPEKEKEGEGRMR